MKANKLGKKSFKQKIQEKHPTFTDSVDGLSIEDLEKNMLIYSKHREDTLHAQKNDPELEHAKEVSKELNAPYTEALTALKEKTAYINRLLKERNGEIETEN